MRHSYERTLILVCYLLGALALHSISVCAQTPARDSVVTVLESGDEVISYVPSFIPFEPIKYETTPPDPFLSNNSKSDHRSLRSSGQHTRSISTSCVVGSIPYEEGVSPSGAKTYSIPIVTEAISHFSPSISLIYNSQAGEGIAGYGWSIAGLSTINISGKSLYYHGVISAPNVSDTDPSFSLDGIPIVQSTESSLLESYPFTTARGNIHIKKHTTSSGAISHFSVIYPDGSRAIFGWQTNSSSSSSYPITLLEDIHGNQIVFNYIQSGGLYLPSAIKYDYIGDSPQGRIVFSYSSRASHTKYHAGESYNADKILFGISSYAKSDSLLAGYHLMYTQKHSAYLLASLSILNGVETINSLKFDYANEPEDADFALDFSRDLSLYFPSGVSTRNIRGKYIPGRFSDGLISLPIYSTYTKLHTYQKKILGIIISTHYEYGSGYSPSQNILISPYLSPNYSTFAIKAEDGFQTIAAIDVDNDGTDEIVKVNYSTCSGDYYTYRIKTYKYNSSANQLDSSYFDINIRGVIDDGGHKSPANRIYFFGRFDDTGHMQLLTISYNKDFRGNDRTSHTSVIDLVNHTKNEYQLFDLSYGDEDRYLVYDMDSDGKTDLCVASSTCLTRYVCNNGVFSSGNTILGLNSIFLSRQHFIADMNGDGYPDIVTAPSEGYDITTYPGWDPSSGEDPRPYEVTEHISGGNIWNIYDFTGSAFVERSCGATTRENGDSFTLIDINFDGLADLIKRSGQTMIVFLNNNGVINSADSLTSSVAIPIGSTMLSVENVFSGKPSHFIAIKDQMVYRYTFSDNRDLDRLIISLQDSFGNEHDNVFLMANNYSVYHHDPSLSYSLAQGYFEKMLPIPVLSQTSYYREGVELYADIGYDYYNSVCNNQGLGFCGFGKIRETNYISGDYLNKIHDPQKFGVPISITISKGDTIPPYSLVTNTYDSNTTTYGKLNPRLTQSIAVDSLSGITTTTSYTYGPYDLPTSIVTSKRIGSGPEQTQTLNRQYQNSLSASLYVLGAITQESMTYECDGSLATSWRERVVNSYDAYFHLTSSQEYKGTPWLTGLIRENRRTYDSYGNVTSEKTAPYGATTFTGDTLIYDSNGRYLLSKTDALGRTTTYSGYNKFGKPTSVTDYHNQVTTYAYDSWGNLVTTTRPDGGIEQTTLAWGGDGLYTVTQTATGTPETITHYDALGREIKSGVKRFDGQWQYTNKEYDSKGRLSRVSLPYRGAAPSYWNTHHYDAYDRPDSLCEASGRRTRWSYNGTSTTTVKDGISSTTTTDAMGRVVSVTDAGGTITYILRDDGQPSSVTAPDNIVTTFTYDTYGRRTQMVDPSLGTESDSYTWNADGSSVFTHTNRNGTVTTSRDRFGRVTYVSRQGEFNTTYTYDYYGRLSSVQSTNNTGKRCSYDDYDRVVTVKDTVPDGKWLQKTYTYGIGSVLSSIAYTSQSGYITTETYTYSNGHNTGITIPGGITVWSLTSENDLGMPTAITTGSITRQYGYTDYGLPTYRKMNNGALQDFSYQFDPTTGNLLQRSGYLSAGTEAFGYDPLNRLASITIGNTTRQITYTDNGNITSIDGVGTLVYGGGSGVSPYEVTGIIPEQGQPGYRQRTVTYNSFDRPSSISENTGVLPSATLIYNADGERVRTVVTTVDGEVRRRYYAGGRYEYDIIETIECLYLGGDAYSAPMVLIRPGGGGWLLFNIGRDYLESITEVIQDSGGITRHYRYNPWGRMMNPSTGELYSTSSEPSLILGRGFTGHEHLPWFGLINANARLYDPLLGRFLSPDPYVQDPDFTQNFNRFSYCLNNPLKYTDESGEILTWNIGNNGFSIGVNFGLFGFGVNLGWGNGYSFGIYGELGPRLGGNGLGYGATISQSLDYNLTYQHLTTTSSGSCYASFACFTVSASFSYSYDIGYKAGAFGWSVGAGLGFGDSISNWGPYVGYGSSGLSYGIGGYYDSSKAYAFRKGCLELGLDPNQAVPATDAYLINSQQYWYPDAPMDNILNFSVETIPNKYAILLKDTGANAMTVPDHHKNTLTGKSSVFFSSKAFSSARQLYITMGHEFVHVSNYISAHSMGLSYKDVNTQEYLDMTEYWAYSFEHKYTQSGMNSFDMNSLITFPHFSDYRFQNMQWYLTRKAPF